MALVDDRDDGVGFGFVAFPGADLQREPMAVHEKPDDDLRIDAAFLAVSESLSSSLCKRSRSWWLEVGVDAVGVDQ